MTPRLVCLTGAESTGKTTLANALAERLGASLVPELARTQLTPGEPYSLEEVVEIAKQQHAEEARTLANRPEGWVIVDTDLLVFRVWLEERFGAWPAELATMMANAPERLYVIAPPEIPWQPDPLREHPNDRWRLHERYVALLKVQAHPWIEVRGSVTERLAAVAERLEIA